MVRIKGHICADLSTFLSKHKNGGIALSVSLISPIYLLLTKGFYLPLFMYLYSSPYGEYQSSFSLHTHTHTHTRVYTHTHTCIYILPKEMPLRGLVMQYKAVLLQRVVLLVYIKGPWFISNHFWLRLRFLSNHLWALRSGCHGPKLSSPCVRNYLPLFFTK